jgi:molybdenum cofactor cytidylyltransferase
VPYRGKSLLRHSAEVVLASVCRPLIVVVGAHAPHMRAELSGLAVESVENKQWAQGVGTSIHRGIEALGTREFAGVLVLVCDQPAVTSEHLNRMVEAFRQQQPDAVASAYGDTYGVPALFDKALFPELLALDGDRGAKAVLTRHAERVVQVPLAQGELDIDTPEDRERLS